MGYLDGDGIDFREEEKSYKPWFKGFLGSNQAVEALKKVASALSEDYKINIVIKDGEEGVAHSNPVTKTITLGTKGIYTKGSDFYVGLLLHEIGHIRHSPYLKDIKEVQEFKNPIIAASLYNMLEDKRIEEKMKEDYSGAHLYFEELNRDLLNQVSAMMGSNLYPVAFTVNEYLSEQINEAEAEGKFKATNSAERVQEQNAYREELKERLLYKTCALAIMIAEGITQYDSSTECKEADQMAERIAHRISEATDPSLENADITRLTMDVLDILDPLIPTKKHSKDKQQQQENEDGEGTEGEGGKGEASVSAHGTHRPGGEILKSMDRGIKTVKSYGKYTKHDSEYSKADARMKPQADALKRKLVAVMRENERSKYVGGKRRGLLNKKSLNRVARDNYRIYRKRFEPKGRKYAVAIVEDCSGSMWSSPYTPGVYKQKIISAHEVTALFTRVFRALGFPVGITIYGWKALTVLQPRDRYVVDAVDKRMVEASDYYYDSGGNETHLGIKSALEYLNKAGAGKQKLMIIITDGGLDSSDVEKSRHLLEKEMKKGDFSPMIFYVDSHQEILKNKQYEAHIPDPSTQLTTEAVRLMKQIVTPIQDID